jgi:hypothetical protein
MPSSWTSCCGLRRTEGEAAAIARVRLAALVGWRKMGR